MHGDADLFTKVERNFDFLVGLKDAVQLLRNRPKQSSGQGNTEEWEAWCEGKYCPISIPRDLFFCNGSIHAAIRGFECFQYVGNNIYKIEFEDSDFEPNPPIAPIPS